LPSEMRRRRDMVARAQAEVERKLAEPPPPFVNAILFAAELKLVAGRIEAILRDDGSEAAGASPSTKALLEQVGHLRALADIVEQFGLVHHG
jgi:hypothetical protein